MSDSDLLIKGDLIKSRWRITHKIGGGGFGQIYQAYDKLRRDLVAVKVESNSQARQGIRMEVTVLRRIQNRKHVCELLSGGTSTLYNYMVITLLGSSLSELRKNLYEQSFTLSTTLRISLQILDAIESIHSIGFLHRDIKPSNFAVGRKNLRHIFILDFGLARKYTDFDQHVRPARIEAGFRGTIRYASINAHNNRELGRHDDLWSFFYMLIEFLIGSLPWSKIKDKESVGRIKETYDYNRFLTYLPNEFDKFLKHIKELHYENKPDYEFLRSLFISSIQRLGYHDDDPYDWEKSNDSLVKIEKQKIPSLDIERKTASENSIDIKRNQSQSPIPNPTEQINQDKHRIDVNSPVKCHLNNRQLIKSSSRTNQLRKKNNSNHNLPLQHSHFILHNEQRNSYELDCIKFDSIGIGDQQQSNQGKLCSQLETRSPNTLLQRNTHLNTIERDPPVANGLLTYISQQFSNAAAPGTQSLFSQWTPHHGETYTDDDLLKGNRSNSSKADERAITLSGERTSPTHSRLNHVNSSIKNKSSGRKPFIILSENISDDENNNNNQNNQKYNFLTNDPCLIEKTLQIPFGTYVKKYSKNTNYNHYNNRRQQISSSSSDLQQFSRNKSHYC
ncbi:unnamed protein product [Rotaria sp. Silwood1]|nr:unnamed protein product [Rotaria sp. Silwood1]CAF3407033.1 unnamed protein product [Rotaria sp. Silwood1]CAF3422791.1 unnamed protein product [Rotaria sp. Silwood1]CAF3427222.1 unnamed protein product [Rotaria sp. Silwood1]CAF4576957.1 unnamed protein product [Rotaria sp. Silwood1]